MIRAVLFDAGGVLFLNQDGEAVVNNSVIDFISKNKASYDFGILSSTTLPLQNTLEACGIASLFRLVETTGKSKIKKDTAQFFIAALRTINLQPHEAVMIDNDTDFIAAAQVAGLHTIQYSVNTDLDTAVKSIL